MFRFKGISHSNRYKSSFIGPRRVMNFQLVEQYDSYIAFNNGYDSKKQFRLHGSANMDLSDSTGSFNFPTGGIAKGVPVAGGFTQSARLISTGNRGATSLTQGNDTALVTTDTYIAEIYMEGNVTVNGVAVLMGSVAGNGHLSVALATSAGAVVASSATTTTSGTSTTFTQVSFSTPYAAIGPATYYVLVQGDNTSDKIRMHGAGNFGAALQTSQTYGTFTTITPPTTFTTNQGPVADLF